MTIVRRLGRFAPAVPSFVAIAAFAVPAIWAAPSLAGQSEAGAEIVLTAEEKAEREGRKACKVAMCSALRAKATSGGDIACDIVKSWRKEQLAKLVGKLKVSWPYEGVRCTSKVAIKRAGLVKAVGDAKAELQLDPHSVTCVVKRAKEEPTNIAFTFSPKVTFENGLATAAEMQWGKIDAPTLIKSGLWTATAADNSVNILSSTLVEDINSFIGKKCDEVKDDWASKR